MRRARVESVVAVALLLVVVGFAAGSMGVESSGGDDGGKVYPTKHGLRGVDFDTPIVDVPDVRLPLSIAGAVMVAGMLVYWRTTSVVALQSAVVFALMVTLWVLLVVLEVPELPPVVFENGNMFLRSAETLSTEPGVAEGVSTTTPVMFLVVAIAAMVVLSLLFASLADSDRLSFGGGGDPPRDEPDEEALAAVGRIAGAAADRLGDAGADVDNEVYRAWDEMTGHLEVDNRGARTPGEFRAAALSAGMAREDVDVLTNLFEEVRYGGAEPTADRERAAVEALRRIERQYADATVVDESAPAMIQEGSKVGAQQ